MSTNTVSKFASVQLTSEETETWYFGDFVARRALRARTLEAAEAESQRTGKPCHVLDSDGGCVEAANYP